jgi:hypothetical protein
MLYHDSENKGRLKQDHREDRPNAGYFRIVAGVVAAEGSRLLAAGAAVDGDEGAVGNEGGDG